MTDMDGETRQRQASPRIARDARDAIPANDTRKGGRSDTTCGGRSNTTCVKCERI